jgi:hypothetical protein
LHFDNHKSHTTVRELYILHIKKNPSKLVEKQNKCFNIILAP